MKPTLTGMTVIGAVLGGAVLYALMSTPASAQPANGAAPVASVPGSKLEGCQRCHQQPLPKDTFDLVLYREAAIWAEKDYHYCAFESLQSPLGQQMNRLLKANRPEGYSITTDVACLACHATDYANAPVGKKQVSDFDTSAGVQCEACHGGAENWLADHFNKPWREVSPADKTKKGLVDLRDPETRAQKCASCHVGNPTEGKFVTHEMYAAGHPPLPAFELLSFSHDEPMHWRNPKDVPHITSLDPAKAQRNYHFSKDDSHQARLVSVGSIVTLREGVRLLAAEAKKNLATPEDQRETLDYAFFDCYACHHDLRYPSPRQKYGYNGTAGRPVMRGPTTLLRAITADLDGQGALLTDLDRTLGDLRKGFDARPFGDPQKIIDAAAKVEQWSANALTAAQQRKYDSAGTRQLIARLMQAGQALPNDVKREPFDPEGARQLASALNRLMRDDFAAEVAPYDPLFQELMTLTRINIRGDQPRPPCKEGPVRSGLEERLKLLYAFDPEAVGKTFEKFHSQWAGKR